MSAGEFTNEIYQLDSSNGGFFMSCRVQPETLAATDGTNANDSAAGPVDAPGRAKSVKGKREFGVGMRAVTLELTGTAPANYSGGNVRIPVLTPATFSAWTVGTSITYLATTWDVVGRSPESVV